MNTVHKNINLLKQICTEFPQQCEAIKEEDFAYKPAPEKWSKKEIVGHLIDSATNNRYYGT